MLHIEKIYISNLDFIPWGNYPVQQPNEPGTNCHYLHYEEKGNAHNGIGDVPCEAYTNTTCFTAASLACRLGCPHKLYLRENVTIFKIGTLFW